MLYWSKIFSRRFLYSSPVSFEAVARGYERLYQKKLQSLVVKTVLVVLGLPDFLQQNTGDLSVTFVKD